MIKRLLLTIIFAAVGYISNAQTIRVTGFEMRNDVVEITYYADVPRGTKLSNFKVYAVINGVSRELSNLSGDIGPTKTGGNKVIYWNCFKEMLTEEISGDVYFKVTYSSQGIALSYRNPRAFNMFLEYAYTPSAPFTFGVGMGGQVGVYARFGTNNIRDYDSKIRSWSLGVYVITFKWLNLNLGYNELRVDGNGYPGYEVGATVLFSRKKWIGVNAGYIGSFQNYKYGEFYVGITLNWNSGV